MNGMQPHIVCLCGSTRFKEAFESANRRETLSGSIVLSVGMFAHADGVDLDRPTKERLDELHRRKIDMADEILVVNEGGYVGESTRNEIAYAVMTNKPIRWWVLAHGGEEWLEANAHDLGRRGAAFAAEVTAYRRRGEK